MTQISTADSIRGLRRQRRLTQEQLAELAGISVSTLKNAENKNSRGVPSGRTLNAIARAFDVPTQDLYVTRSTVPDFNAETDDRALAELRAAISPPIGITGVPIVVGVAGPVDLNDLTRRTRMLEKRYRADLYDEVASKLPRLLHDAHRAVAELETEDAYRVRARAMQMAGRYLTQVRQLDLAMDALLASIRDARAASDQTLAAASVNGQGWALVRQGRLQEAEHLCVTAADAVEPRISSATPDELAVWGNLLFRASSAAVRNNGYDRAKDLLRIASGAASALGREHEVGGALMSWATFGPMTIALKEAEFDLIAAKPDRTLNVALPDPEKVGKVTPLNWNRHRLDIAESLAMTRRTEEASHVMIEVIDRAPEWVRRQKSAYQAAKDIAKDRPRTLTAEMSRIMTHLGVVA